MPSGSEVPRWNLDAIYPGYDSEAYRRDRKELVGIAASLVRRLDDRSAKTVDSLGWLEAMLTEMDTAVGLHETLEAYVECAYAVNTNDARTLTELNSIEEDSLVLHEAQVRFRNELKSLREQLPAFAERSEIVDRLGFYLDEQITLADKQMSVEEENLAADLMRPGADAWTRLQESVSSNLTWPWEGDERKTVVELRSLANDPRRAVREQAYRRELDAWKSVETPIAAALNGVKGFAVILDRRRHYESPLDRAALQSRVSRSTLDAQISTMERNLDVFRSYLRTKARLLGVPRCTFYDLFAPIGEATRTWSFAEAREFIVEQFGSFSAELADFAQRAFAGNWIDAEPREGKVGGAFCASLPRARESRILANFDGSFDSLFTLAHELGHGYHGFVLNGLPYVQQDYPMPLAETASIFCETIVFNRALDQASRDDRIAILELFLQGATQVIVDILSRYQFESAVFEQRARSELRPQELCELMRQAQIDTYGDGLDHSALHPYMWAAKPHYYRSSLSFYNFPYAFGQLFGLGLYSDYTRDVRGFPARYRSLLEMTGRATATEVTRAAGFDIEDEAFWQSGIDVIAGHARELAALASERSA